MLPLYYLEGLSWLYRLCFKLYSLLREPMYSRRLSSIPERSEAEEEQSVAKWVPKQKHEVLKAKYKCLKKLFQVYDASLINMLPDPYVADSKQSKKAKEVSKPNSEKEHKKKKRKIRRRNSDTSSDNADSEKNCLCVASSLLKDLKMKKCTLGPTLVDAVGAKDSKQAFNVKCIKTESETDAVNRSLNESVSQTAELKRNIQDFPVLNCTIRRPFKLTRMQILKYRLFGHKPKALRQSMHLSPQQQYLPDYTSSFNSPRPVLRRRLRLSRYKAREVRSCDGMLEGFDPELIGRIQSVQQSCLLDTTPRVCPFPGCGITLNGIINYNDHLRLCHFPERKFVCHYCHDAFQTEREKIAHENEHIGIFKPSSDAPKQTDSILENLQRKETQRDVVCEEKLRKIVSYFDKIATGDGCYDAFGNRVAGKCANRVASCTSACVHRHKPVQCCAKSLSCMRTEAPKKSEHIAMACKVCGEFFRISKQLKTHMDEQHPWKAKCRSVCDIPVKGSDEKLNVSVGSSFSDRALSRDVKSCVSLDYEPSANIIYHNSTSMESLCRRPSVFDRLVGRVRSVRSLQNPKWEPAPTVLHI